MTSKRPLVLAYPDRDSSSLKEDVVPHLSVVIPALNEAGNIGTLVTRIKEVVDKLSLTAEIIVVDGGSRDATWAEAEAAGARCLLQRRVGYGGALREGFMAARGQYILTLDSDLSHPPELLNELWNARERADIIIGSRFIPGGSSAAPLGRKMLSRILNRIFVSLLAVPIEDLSSGYRLYRRDVLRPELYRPENFNILQEILVRACSDGYSVEEIPLQYLPREYGSSHVALGKFAVSYIGTLYRLWILRHSVSSADYEHHAFDSRHVLQRYWQRKRYALINEFLEGKSSICDIGCGSSRFTTDHPSVVALDRARQKLRFLKRTNPHRICSDGRKLPFSDGSFDGVLLSQILNYASETKEVIIEANRILTMGGRVVITVQDSARIRSRIIKTFYHLLPNTAAKTYVAQLSRSELIDLLAENGFRTLRYCYILGSELVLCAEKVEG